MYTSETWLIFQDDDNKLIVMENKFTKIATDIKKLCYIKLWDKIKQTIIRIIW